MDFIHISYCDTKGSKVVFFLIIIYLIAALLYLACRCAVDEHATTPQATGNSE